MNLVERVKNILIVPKTEWPAIEAEPTSVRDIYTGYVAPLALIPIVAGFVGSSLVGYTLGQATFRVPIVAGLFSAVLQFGLSLALVYAMAMIIDALAPTFGGVRNFPAAFKVAAYSYTPAWLTGIFALVPSLAFLAILGLYGLYLLYLGLPRLMHAPEEKAVGYTAVVVVAGIVLALVVALFIVFVVGVPSAV